MQISAEITDTTGGKAGNTSAFTCSVTATNFNDPDLANVVLTDYVFSDSMGPDAATKL